MKIVAILLVCLVGGPAVIDASEADIRDAILAVDPDSMMASVERLVAFDTRFMGSDSNWAAVAWIESRFEAMGYAVERDSFEVNVNTRVLGQTWTLSDLTQVNVVARRKGAVSPDEKIVLGAHYDSISLDKAPDDQGFAPGADDNATGVAAVMEIARVMKDLQTGMTLEFVLFGAEELGLVGSQAYASRAHERGEEIVLMLGLDVLGTRSTVFSDAFTLDATPVSLTLAEQVADAAETYTDVFSRDGSSNARIMVTATGCRCSDHQSFLDHGIPAVGVFQFFTNPAPHINMSTDTIEHVDITYARQVAQAVMAGALEIAGFPGRTPDFDGDGIVAFNDFLLFAEAFGEEFAAPEDERFDLDANGIVGFSDFLIFSGSFGRVLS
jgi:hypothetical protein